MLVLERGVDESVYLTHKHTGERIRLMVVQTGVKCRIGFDAPRHWLIDRIDASGRDERSKKCIDCGARPATRLKRCATCHRDRI